MADKANSKNTKTKKTEFLGIIAKVVGSLGFRIMFYAALIMLFYYGSVRAYRFGYRIFAGPAVEAAPGTDVVVVIDDEMSDAEIVSLLERKGLVKDTRVFRILLRLYTNSRYGIVEGEYTLNTSMTSLEMINRMSDSRTEASTAHEEHLGLYDEETAEMTSAAEGSAADGS